MLVWFFLLCSEEEDTHLLQIPESLGHIQLENQTVYVWSPLAGECSVSCGGGEIFLCCRKMLLGCMCQLRLRNLRDLVISPLQITVHV